MLSDAQLKMRQMGLGASEVPAVLGLSPWQEPLDVWATKRRGKSGEIPPLIEKPQLDADSPGALAVSLSVDPRIVGSVLEDGIAEIYRVRMGGDLKLARADTQTGPEPWQLATPDRIVVLPGAKEKDLFGLECKAVGRRTIHAWDDVPIPDYVLAQVMWSMHVCRFERWDVCANLAGTEARIETVERDADLLRGMVEICTEFWRKYVEGDEQPPATSSDGAYRIAVAKWAKDNGESIDAPEEAAPLVAKLIHARAAEKEAREESRRLKARLCAMVGEARSMVGDWGRFSWPTRRGSVAWKALAEHLSDGPISDDLLEEFRAASYRSSQLYPKKVKA